VIIGCEREGRIEGYMVFDFEKGESFILNDIHIREWVYENHAALSELMTYLHTQADQIRHVIFETLDPTFYFLLSDPRNGAPEMIPSVYHESNVQGVRAAPRARFWGADVPPALDADGQLPAGERGQHDGLLPTG
jgi:hypothetical protein